jgi:hypothetical protein
MSRLNLVRIFQIYYQEQQKKFLDKDFIPYDNSVASEPDFYEFGVFLQEYQNSKLDADEYLGFVSWKFSSKTKISGESFKKFIFKNPNHDVYFINPFPLDIICFKNIWYQGDYHHKGILEFTNRLLKNAGYNIDLSKIITSQHNGGFCNYWVGNKIFWDKYISFCKPLYHYIKYKSSEAEKIFLFSNADEKIKAHYIPFIFERLFSTLLFIDPDIKYISWTNSNEVLKNTLGDLKDIAIHFDLNKQILFSEELPSTITSSNHSYGKLIFEHILLLNKHISFKKKILNPISSLKKIFAKLKQ